jgi:N-methylhydantoinase A
VSLGVDVGGTFTDVVIVDRRGRLWEHKVPTTTDDEAAGFVTGALELLERAGCVPSDVTQIVHGSTIGTNAILERSGPLVALITTAGFRDVLEIARIRTPTLYNLRWQKPEPLVPRRYRFEVPERIDAAGDVIAPLDEAALADVLDRIRRLGISSIAVCFINAPMNPAHEQRASALIADVFPTASVSISSDVLSELKEYERTSTTVVNAYLQPVMQKYLATLRVKLSAAGIVAPLHIMRSDGGMMSAAAAMERPVSVVVSGPAAGATACEVLARQEAIDHALAFDMGGTTAKAAVVEGGRVARVNEYEVRSGISTPSRFIKAGGYLLMVPAIDLAEVGNGAGSIVRVDAAGALRVGPESAGAVPGPACYDRGGTRATITDANVVLGYLNPKALVAGQLPIRADLAAAAVAGQAAEPLGLSTEEAAWGVFAIANANMIRALRAVSVERGRDARTYTLVAFGGSGPVHGAAIAREMGMTRVLVPPLAGTLSAVGLLHAEPERHFSRAWTRQLSDVTVDELSAELDALAAGATVALRNEGYEEVATEGYLDLRYGGQTTTLTIPFQGRNNGGIEHLTSLFEQEYLLTYRHQLAEHPIEVVNLRAILRAAVPSREFRDVAISDDGGASTGSRAAYFGPEVGFVETEVISRAALGESSRSGPLLIEELDTTIVVPPSADVRRDTASGNVVIGISS